MKYVEGLVSVIMPTYKRSEKLLRAIDSVLNQTYSNLELLLVNDNEPLDAYTQQLKTRVAKYSDDKRFKLILQEKHINGAVARNIGIKQANGQYIAFLDDDDWWEKNKLEEQVKTLRSLDDTWGGVSCKFTLYDKNGNIIGKTRKYKDGYIYKDILNLMSDVATGTLLLRHDYFDTTRYFDEKLLRHQDLQLLVDFTSKYKLKEVDQYLHCVDVSDSQNRPDAQKLMQYKKAFFKSVKPVMDSLSEKDRNCVYAMHRFELGYVCLKSGNKAQGASYCKSVLKSPKACGLALKKIITKLIQTCSR
ncbi:glycosyltransferase family 2 protein [Phascolarctobacterium succinatutens]|uniref:glycosyltransferase family 2 protein n=1 Tax=Phascolarctobacterium succinatutens TaxID=626940 RepID=UPI003AF8BF98